MSRRSDIVPPEWRPAILAAVIFAAASLGAFWAHQEGRVISTATIYLFGVTLVGAIAGLRGGLVAALAASLIYNFFLSDPIFQFSLTTADELAPLVAFNLAAIASGYVAGRLRDEARKASLSNRKLDALLNFSERLQSAIEVDGVLTAGARFLGDGGGIGLEYYRALDGGLAPTGAREDHRALAEALLASGESALRNDKARAFAIVSADKWRGVLVARDAPGGNARQEGSERDGFITLLGLALERCVLLEELAQADAVRRSEELKTALISSVSHDLRTPLGAISASASSLARYHDELSRETRIGLLRTIQEQCSRLNGYTTNLLNLGRIQAGVARADMPHCDALEVLGSAIARARALGGSHRLEKRFDTAAAQVHADPVMLEQVFYNVLENAVRYTDREGRILVSAELDGDALVVEVNDDGPGIAPAEREKVFQRFYRGNDGGTTGGTGLGLSIARGFTEAFGGSIQAGRAIAPLGGAAIAIRLPVAGQSCA